MAMQILGYDLPVSIPIHHRWWMQPERDAVLAAQLAVSIPIHHRWWMQRQVGRRRRGGQRCFNPHPPSLVDATVPRHRYACPHTVSIPIHHRWWMQQGRIERRRGGTRCFNPHPPSLVDATRAVTRSATISVVSIPIHHRWWMQQVSRDREEPQSLVSIPIHHRWWMQRHQRPPRRASSATFGPESAPLAPVGRFWDLLPRSGGLTPSSRPENPPRSGHREPHGCANLPLRSHHRRFAQVTVPEDHAYRGQCPCRSPADGAPAAPSGGRCAGCPPTL